MVRRSRLLGEGRHPSRDIQRLASDTFSAKPVGEIDAARIADEGLELDKECILERSRVVSIAPARMPYIGLVGRYNKRWYVDAIALPHNSVRTFISRVFEILTATHRLALDMTESDFEKLFVFLGEFDRYVRVLLEAEEKILYPEVDGALKKRDDFHAHALNPTVRAQTKAEICGLLDAITDRDIHTTPSIIVAHVLQAKVDNLSSLLLEYFSAKEAELPRIISRSIRGPKEKNRLEGRLIKYFEDLNQEFHYTAILAAPLTHDEVRADFEQRHFSKSDREQFREAVIILNNSLFAIPKAFDQAASKYESRFSMTAFLEHYGQNRDADATTELVT